MHGCIWTTRILYDITVMGIQLMVAVEFFSWAIICERWTEKPWIGGAER